MSSTNTDPETIVTTGQELPTTKSSEDPATEPPPGSQAATEPAPESSAATEAPPESSAGSQGSSTPRTSRLSPKARRLVPITLAVLVTAAAVPVGLLGWQAISVARADRDATAAVDAARTGVSQALSYDSKTLDADLARARTHLTGTFAAQFEETVSEVIVPASKGEEITSKTEVLRSALMDAQPDRADVLLFLRQTSTASSRPQPQEGIVEVTVTMTRTADGQWLISDVQPA